MNKKIIFVSDAFAKDYLGGAELTTQALIDERDKDIDLFTIYSREINPTKIESEKDSHWVICNFSQLSSEAKLHICKNVNYSIIEYDYKFCKYRSLEGHRIVENKECDCSTKPENKINLVFYGLAKCVWFMSEIQRNIFLKNVPSLKEEKTKILNSVFSKGDLNFIDSMKYNEKDGKYLIVKSNSWVKGFEKCVEYAQKNNLNYEIVSGLPYHEMLIRLSTAKGLIFLPVGADTCPRLVMEAQMLGCELHLNELVQHKDEFWAKDSESCRKHMNDRVKEFWSFYE